nr:pseudouridine synthase [uncultured Carboxylicivirga sp.]
MSNISIIYQDDDLIVVDKPIDLPVHKNDFMPADADYLTKQVGLITGKSVFPVHRLDSKTSGIIVLAFSREIASDLTKQFEQRKVEKSYAIVCKGIPGEGTFDKPVVVKKKKKRVSANTAYKTIKSVSTKISYKDITDVEISLVIAKPTTGRWHQLRQHFAFERFDILGDTQHGDWTLNKIMTAQTGVKRLLLHAYSLGFTHPVSGEKLNLKAPIPEEFEQVLEQLQGCEINNFME